MKIDIMLVDTLEHELRKGKKIELFTTINTIRVNVGKTTESVQKVNEATMLCLLSRNLENATSNGYGIELQIK